MKHLLFSLIALALISPLLTYAQSPDELQGYIDVVPQADAYIFVREDCSHCQDLKAFIEEQELISNRYTISYIDLYTPEGRILFDHATELLGTGKVTPISFIDNAVYVGFAEDTVGKALLAHSKIPERTDTSFDSYLTKDKNNLVAGEVCPEDGSVPCEVPAEETLTIPVLGTIDPQTVSLSFMAIALGFVDGFNPCAMWVLLTFLLILSQLGDRKKMVQVAGLFIVAEAVMYFLILNVWYQTWDFIALDNIVTPLVGLLGIGSGSFFLYKYWTTRNAPLTCDVTSLEHQNKTENKIKDLVSKPMTFLGAIAIIGLALSVNVIEFACSVGIPQAFTKVLELNNLSFLGYQGYTLLYTVFYMADDVIVFALAIWGYQKFYAVGQKYSKISTLIAGILMLILGFILLTNPNILTF